MLITSHNPGFGGGRSHRRASPRSGYLKRMYAQLRRLLRDLLYYMKRHPMKVFMLVIMPLITGGALTGLLQRFGIRLPGGLERMLGMSSSGMGRYGSVERLGRDGHGDLQWERSRVTGDGVRGLMEGAGGLMSMAKMFM
ncbi:hypothetical protein BP6252_05120 [Coleophoma cylindrospora]|uniref:Uncharacterized protein n=1 Tax=Coleophoma cylindrospora TaxID=1849047 RepID=A0A3D8RSK8_9HELO|nr:hypothetical protein BP6252_05120 [Coleophoma cylindrospora]